MIDPYWYALACVLLGGVLGVLIPYLFKVMDGNVPFNYSYFYGMCIAMAVAAAGMVPESIELTGRTIMMLVMAGFGIQHSTNLVTSKIRKGIATKE